MEARGNAAWASQGPGRGMAAILNLIADSLPEDDVAGWLRAEAAVAETGK